MDELLESFAQGMLLTLHVDMIMKLQHDREFYGLLSHDVITCDSQILFAASKVLGTPLRERVSGSDFFPRYYMRHKDDPSVTVFICGAAPEIAKRAADNVNARVGREMVVGSCSPPFDYDRRPDEIERMISRINESRATALVVGLGAGRQEKFIVRYRWAAPSTTRPARWSAPPPGSPAPGWNGSTGCCASLARGGAGICCISRRCSICSLCSD